MPIQDQKAPEPLPIGRPQHILHQVSQGGQAQAERSGILEKVGRDAKIHRRGHQHAAGLAGSIGQRQRDFDISQHAQVAVLLASAQDDHQAVVGFEIVFNVKPVEFFEAHFCYLDPKLSDSS